MSILDRLADLGIEIPDVAAPVAAYVPAKAHGDLVYTSGQLPFMAGVLPATGKVGDEVSPADAAIYARQSALNAIAAAGAAVGGAERLTGVLKLTGFVASAEGFTGQPGDINGASEFLGEVFGESGEHARSAVGVAELPLASPVEVEVVFTWA